ncbi:hypothetical protein Tco_0066621 [Tanacetum coccineum]
MAYGFLLDTAAFAVVSGEESHCNATSVGATKPAATAFAAKTFDNKRITKALITKINNLKINNDITLYDVLVVPGHTVSLLSVHKIDRDNKLFVGFDETKCYIQDLKANETVRIGNQCNGLYLLDVDNACKVMSNNCIASCYVSRLGYPADQAFVVLKSTLNLDNHSVCNHLCDTSNKPENHFH